MREVNLEHDIDWMVVLADDLQTKVDSEGQKVESCPNGKEGVAGQRWKKFKKRMWISFACVLMKICSPSLKYLTILLLVWRVNREVIFSCSSTSIPTYEKVE